MLYCDFDRPSPDQCRQRETGDRNFRFNGRLPAQASVMGDQFIGSEGGVGWNCGAERGGEEHVDQGDARFST